MLDFEKKAAYGYYFTFIKNDNPNFINTLFQSIVRVKRNELKMISYDYKNIYTDRLNKKKIVIKYYPPYSRIKLKYNKNCGRAMRSFKFARHLIENNINTPWPIACIEKYRKGKIIESYYISEYLHGAIQLQQALSYDYNYNTKNLAIDILKLFATYIKKMHDSNFTHGDLSHINIMIDSPRNKITDQSFFLIDLDRGKIGHVSRHQRAKDLQRISLPQKELDVFWKFYLDTNELTYMYKKKLMFFNNQYRRHCRTRRLRHTIRNFMKRK